MKSTGVRDDWIYFIAGGWLAVRFRVMFKTPTNCHCGFKTVDCIEYTIPNPNNSLINWCACESCWHKLVGHDVVFLTPEEGRPYFEVLPV